MEQTTQIRLLEAELEETREYLIEVLYDLEGGGCPKTRENVRWEQCNDCQDDADGCWHRYFQDKAKAKRKITYEEITIGPQAKIKRRIT